MVLPSRKRKKLPVQGAALCWGRVLCWALGLVSACIFLPNCSRNSALLLMQMRKLKLPYVSNLCKVTRSVSGCPTPPVGTPALSTKLCCFPTQTKKKVTQSRTGAKSRQRRQAGPGQLQCQAVWEPTTQRRDPGPGGS